MREIKFRGKSFDTGEWVYGDYHKRAEGVHCIIKMEPDENGKVVYTVHQAVPDTIGQFTGLHDKNGKEIYEGDILRGDDYPFYDAEKDSYNYYAIVEWDEEAAQFYAYIHLTKDAEVRGISQGICEDMENLREMEVIGNIHDNHELDFLVERIDEDGFDIGIYKIVDRDNKERFFKVIIEDYEAIPIEVKRVTKMVEITTWEKL